MNENQVLVKTYACPINPLDILKLNNIFNITKFPLVLGSEFSGEVINAVDKNLIGRKISSLVGTGAFKSYHVVNIENLLFHDDKVDMNSIELSKFKDGKAVEHWSFAQMADMMKMMGTPPPPMPMHGDSL